MIVRMVCSEREKCSRKEKFERFFEDYRFSAKLVSFWEKQQVFEIFGQEYDFQKYFAENSLKFGESCSLQLVEFSRIGWNFDVDK